jgi:hypothetical protein
LNRPKGLARSGNRSLSRSGDFVSIQEHDLAPLRRQPIQVKIELANEIEG